MALSPKEVKIVEMTRFLDDLERAAPSGPAIYEQVFNSPPPGLSVHEINTASGHAGFAPARCIPRFWFRSLRSLVALAAAVPAVVEHCTGQASGLSSPSA